MTVLERLARRLDALDQELEAARMERDHSAQLYRQMLERCRKVEDPSPTRREGECVPIASWPWRPPRYGKGAKAMTL